MNRRRLSAIFCVVIITCTFVLGDHKYEEQGNTCTAGGEEGGCEVKSIREQLEDNLKLLQEQRNTAEEYIHVIITFKNAGGNINLQRKFGLTVQSLLSVSSVGVGFLIIGDSQSQMVAKSIINEKVEEYGITTPYQVAELDADLMAKELHTVVEPMQRYFSAGSKAYYGDSLFFLSIAIHRVMPESLDKVIMIDADLKFKSDAVKLYNLFDEFSDDAVLGIARDAQPVYRHQFSRYRRDNENTRVGDPPPHGLTGFNSGVLLLNLAAMRSSQLYNSLINEETLIKLSDKYSFKGHLGDQDFFTLISMDYEQLFYVLPCGWNRQLCTWWKDKGYESVFDQYYNCEGPVYIYHGNCNTPIPTD